MSCHAVTFGAGSSVKSTTLGIIWLSQTTSCETRSPVRYAKPCTPSLRRRLSAEQAAGSYSREDYDQVYQFSREYNRLGHSILQRYREEGDLTLLSTGHRHFQQAIAGSPLAIPWPTWTMYLNNLGNTFQMSYERTGSLSDLNAALQLYDFSLKHSFPGDPNVAAYHDNLGIAHHYRFERLGDPSDLEAAFLHKQLAVAKSQANDPMRPRFLQDLGHAYMSRYADSHAEADLQTAMDYYEQALNLTPDTHIDVIMRHNSLANTYWTRYNRDHRLPDIELAAKHWETALEKTPPSHHLAPAMRANLANAYQDLFSRTGEFEYIDKAITYQKDAIEAVSQDPTEQELYLYFNNLSCSYFAKYEKLGDPEDLNEAIAAQYQAINHCPEGHPKFPWLLQRLGTVNIMQLTKTGLTEALACWKRAIELNIGPPDILLTIAIMLGDNAYINGRYDVATEGYIQALKLLPRAVSIDLDLQDRRHAIEHAKDLAANAAACFIHNGQLPLAVEALEHGRSIMFTQMLNLRSSFDELESVSPELHAKLLQLSAQLRAVNNAQNTNTAPDAAVDPTDTGSPAVRLSRQWERLMTDIRRLPGFSSFMEPPSLEQIFPEPKDGSVIILNCSSHRCDALIIPAGRMVVYAVPLRAITRDIALELRQNVSGLAVGYRSAARDAEVSDGVTRHLRRGRSPSRSLEDILDELWRKVVEPVITVLHSLEPKSDRLWWCPTGAFTGLPFHAALLYAGAKMPEISQYISSYIPSLSSLSPAKRSVSPVFKLLSVAISRTRGYEPLPETLTEARYIHEIVPPDLQVSFINEQASTSSITSILPSCPWAHFSCHGIQDHSDPFKSGLLMPDGSRLHLADLINLSLPQAQFVFLSACQTGLGDIQLLDESLHLAGGFLFAGFRSAVATLWAMDDADGPRVAREVYAYLFRGGRRTPDLKEVPLALHRAVVMLQASGVPARRWVPYIHMGI